jgi:hypothetical protein
MNSATAVSAGSTQAAMFLACSAGVFVENGKALRHRDYKVYKGSNATPLIYIIS